MSKVGFRNFLIATVCFIPFALSINLLSWQFKLVSGGFPGYALVANYVTDTSVGTYLIIMNTIVLVANFIFVGKHVGFKGVYGYVVLSLLIDITRELLSLSQYPVSNLFFSIFLSSLQGITGGSIIGIIIYLGYNFGSYSSLILLVNKFWKITPPPFFLLMDFLLACITTYLFGLEKGILLLLNAVVFFFAFKFTLQTLKKFGSAAK